MKALVFPLLLAVNVLVTLRLLASDLPRPAVSGVVLFSTIAILLALERLWPLHRAWNAAPDRTDLLLVVGNRFIDVAVISGTVYALAVVQPSWSVWPRSLPLVAQAALGIVIGEAARYALHRASHRPGVLGRVHATHHAPSRMYVLNGPRLHPANQLWLTLANGVPMLVLGADLSAVILAINVTVFFVLLQHSNIDLPFTGFNLVFATPDVHRLHHLREEIGIGVNYGIVLLAFDQIFGTYHAPVAVTAGEIGASA